MEKCYIIIVDTLNHVNFNSKKVKNILNDVLITDFVIFENKNSFLEKNVKFIEFDKNCDVVELEKALLKDHLFINIISSNTKQMKGIDIFDFNKSSKEANLGSYSLRHFNHLKHAFTSRNKNTLYLMVNDCDAPMSESGFFENWMEIEWFEFKPEICRDQLIHINSNRSYEIEMKRWLLLKLISLEGNFYFYCLHILSRMISSYCGLVDMDESTLYIDECISVTQEQYTNTVSSLLSIIDRFSSNNDFNRPIFLHSSCNADWNVVKNIIHSHFSANSDYVGHYRSRLHPVSQDINLLLVSLLRFFKVSPQKEQLPFTTAQMSTLVNDCLSNSTKLSSTKKYIFFIEDIDWIVTNHVSSEACSWLPEKCASNILVIMTSANDSLQQKSLKARLLPPIFIDVSFPESLRTGVYKKCVCSQRWCVSRILRTEEIFRDILTIADSKGIGDDIVKILAILSCSFVSSMTVSQIEFLLSHILPNSSKSSADYFMEKDNSEQQEKSIMYTTKVQVKWPVSERTEKALLHLVQSRVLCRTYLKNTCESSYTLAIPQLKGHLVSVILDRTKQCDLDMIRCYIGSYFVYQSTDINQQMLFVSTHLQYLSSIKDVVLRDWLLNWVVLMKFSDEYSVPVKLLSLWRSILGSDTDYSPMLNAYITTCLPQTRCSNDCQTCHQSQNDIALEPGSVCLDSLLHPTMGLSKKATRNRCRILLELARLAMQVGQYSVAKEMARVLLKLLDHNSMDRSLWTIPGPDKNLLASCLHLLFCTLDERLKTFEFVTEQTTPIFRRTVHYGARALLLQDTIVEQLKRTLDRSVYYGSGDGQTVDVEKLQQKLCSAEIRLARIMTHFVFSLDGVEQTAINRHFLPSKIKAVTHACMTRAYEIASRLRDRSLLLEMLMTFGVIQPRENCKEKIMLYKTPLRQALCMYGQSHIFVSRIYINIGISYEEQKKYIKAFEYFTLWSHITHELLGRSHCKSVRSCGVFKEPIFKMTAEFITNLNGETPNESLEDELKCTVEHGDQDQLDVTDLSVEGVRLGGNGAGAATGAGDGTGNQNLSLENMFALRTSMEQETDWEMHSSDDETPNYTTSFEEVIDKFHKTETTAGSQSVDLLRSLLDSSLVDPEDLNSDDIAFLVKSHENRLAELSSESQSYEGTVVEALRITRLFRGLQDLTQIFPSSSPGSSLDLNLTARLLELQRDLQDFLYN